MRLDSAADVSAVGRDLPSSELGFKGSSTESSAGIAVNAASGRAAQSAKSKRVVQKRGVRWGPFLLSPIVPQGGQTGWGAICGLHHNRGDGSGSRCKKESFEHGPVEPQRLHITIETVASSRAQCIQSFLSRTLGQIMWP